MMDARHIVLCYRSKIYIARQRRQHSCIMRHGRAKAARKTLQFLARTQGYKLPYNILLDGTFCVAAMRMKIPVGERLVRLLQEHGDDKVRLHVTQSTLEELRTLADQATKHQEYFQEAHAWVQTHAQIVASISSDSAASDPTLSETAQDILRVLSCKDEHALKYFLASQDEQLLHSARNRAIPCLRLQRTVLLLEQPSKVAELQDRGLEKRKWKDSVPEPERKLVSMIRSEQKQQQASSSPHTGRPQRPKKKAKGPNPLSCKRKQSANGDGDKPKSSKRIKS
jgi:U3 small nucleolar RNA-associated protein 23